MRKMLLVVVGGTLLLGCRDGDAIQRDREKVGVGKPVEITVTPRGDDHEFTEVRISYESTTRSRLERIDSRLHELGARADAAAQDAVSNMRARREQLAARLDTAKAQAKTSWDRFQADLSRSVDELEADIDTALR